MIIITITIMIIIIVVVIVIAIVIVIVIVTSIINIVGRHYLYIDKWLPLRASRAAAGGSSARS